MSNRIEGKAVKPPVDDQEAFPVTQPSNDNGASRKPPPSRYIQTSEDNKSSFFEKFVVYFCLVFVVLFFPLSLCFCIIVVPEYIRLIILRLGRLRKGAKGPGLVFYLPCIDAIQAVDMRTDVYKVFTVNAVIYYCIHDAIDSIIQVDNVEEATLMIAKVTLRNIVGSKTLNVLLTSRQALSREILQAVAGITARWGVRMERVDLMDIILPASLERSLASEAEAVREARAKIILAEGELKASNALKVASDVMAQNHITLQLRHLQALPSLATEKRVNIIYPIPLEIMEPFFDKEEWSKMDPDGDETDFSNMYTPKIYMEGSDLPEKWYDPEGSDDAEITKPTSPWRLLTIFRRLQGDKDATPLPKKRSEKAPLNQPKGAAESVAEYPLLPSTLDRPSSPRSAPEIRPKPSAPPTLPPKPTPTTPPTLPPIPPPPPPPPSRPIPPASTLPPIPPPPTLPPIPPPPTPPAIPKPPSPPPESQDKSNLKPDDNYYF